jgi:hypothetical protein
MVDVSLVPEAAWHEAQRRAAAIRPLVESAQPVPSSCAGRRGNAWAVRATDLYGLAALPGGEG